MTRLYLTALLVLAAISPGVAASVPCPEYAEYFKTSARRYLSTVPVIGWEYLAAQVEAESSCRANAKSPVGARGPAQFMMATWEEQRLRVPALEHASPENPKYAIIAQANYMRELYEFCGKRIEGADPIELRKHTTASYNAGLGNICVKAYKLSGSPFWVDTAEALPRVTGRHSKETTGYVRRIEDTHRQSASRRQQASEDLFSFVASAEASEAPHGDSVKVPEEPETPPEPSKATPWDQIAEAMDVLDGNGGWFISVLGIALFYGIYHVIKKRPTWLAALLAVPKVYHVFALAGFAFLWACYTVVEGMSTFWQSIILSYKFAFLPAVIALAIMYGSYKIVDHLTDPCVTADELHDNNTAYAMFLCTWLIVIGAVLCVSIYAGMTG